jgi:hypothetical protein
VAGLGTTKDGSGSGGSKEEHGRGGGLEHHLEECLGWKDLIFGSCRLNSGAVVGMRLRG